MTPAMYLQWQIEGGLRLHAHPWLKFTQCYVTLWHWGGGGGGVILVF